MPKKRINIDTLISYNAATNKSTCVIETCKKVLSGRVKRNIIRHYQNVHKLDLKSDDDSDSDYLPRVCKMKLGTTKFNTHTDTMNKNDFLKCCIGLVTKKSMPLRILDDQEFFQQIIAPYEQKFNINLSSSNIEKVLENRSNQIKSEIADLVRNKMISLKIDIASQLESGVLGINIQYIHDFKICNNTIGMVQTTKYDTAEDLKEEILKCLEEYDIDINQIYTYTTDNAAYVIKLVDETQLESLDSEDVEIDIDSDSCNLFESYIGATFSVVRCIAHSIQLVAYDVIKTAEDDIDECRKVAKKLRGILGSSSDSISLPYLDVITRWDSTYNMIRKLLSLKDLIESLGNLITYVNWIFIEDFINALTPLAKCALKLQNEQYILGDFFRDWLNCGLELGDLAPKNQYATALLNAMTKTKDIFLQHDAFVAAIYLDPRFNFHGTPFLNEEHKRSAMDHLLQVYKNNKNLKTDSRDMELSNSSNLSSYDTRDDVPTTSANAYDKLDFHVQNLLETQKLSAPILSVSIKHKLMKLSDGERVTFGTNVLEYWRKTCGGDKEMTELVETVLSLPATQISVRRSLSGISTIRTNQQSKLSKKSISNLLVVKLNYDLLNFKNFEEECNKSNTENEYE